MDVHIDDQSAFIPRMSLILSLSVALSIAYRDDSALQIAYFRAADHPTCDKSPIGIHFVASTLAREWKGQRLRESR